MEGIGDGCWWKWRFFERGHHGQTDALWSHIGCFQIGIDISIYVEDNGDSFSSSKDDELEKDCTNAIIVVLMDFVIDDCL